jgi:hypothetical protein
VKETGEDRLKTLRVIAPMPIRQPGVMEAAGEVEGAMAIETATES